MKVVLSAIALALATAPAWSQDLTAASKGTGRVRLRWTAAPDYKGDYVIHRNQGKGWRIIARVAAPATTYLDSTAQPGQATYYQVHTHRAICSAVAQTCRKVSGSWTRIVMVRPSTRAELTAVLILKTLNMPLTPHPQVPAVASQVATATKPPFEFSPKAMARAVRPDLWTGKSLPAVPLRDATAQVASFPVRTGGRFTVALDALPHPSKVDVSISISGARGTRSLVKRSATLPFTTTVEADDDGRIDIAVFDPLKAGLTLTKFSVKLAQKTYDSTGFRVFVHVAGDAFPGVEGYNDLAGPLDQIRFTTDLLVETNRIFAPTGIQIDVAKSGNRRLKTSDIQKLEPGLVKNGKTILDISSDGPAAARRWGRFGVAATDKNHGRSVDVFLVQAPATNAGFGGWCPCDHGLQIDGRRMPAGTALGNGDRHAVVLWLFDTKADAMPKLGQALAHELGHFLSLQHTTETTLVEDDLLDTPATPKDGMLGDSSPDSPNIMFPWIRSDRTTWTVEQGNAMRAWLAQMEH